MTIRDPETTAILRRDVLAGRRRHTNARPSLEGHTHAPGDITVPRAVLVRTTAKSTASGTVEPVNMALSGDSGNRFATGGMVAVSGDDGGIQVPTTGWYLVTLLGTWANNSTGVRVLYTRRNTTEAAASEVIRGYRDIRPATGNSNQAAAASVLLDSGDIVGLAVLQTSGSSLNLAAASMSAQLIHAT